MSHFRVFVAHIRYSQSLRESGLSGCVEAPFYQCKHSVKEQRLAVDAAAEALTGTSPGTVAAVNRTLHSRSW